VRWVRLFQGLEHPDSVLRLSGWESREAYSRYTDEEAAGRQDLDALSVGMPERYFFEQLSFQEIRERKATAVSCGLFEAPSAAAQDVLTVLEAVRGPEMQRRPGFVLRELYRDVDASRFLVVNGWQSLGALLLFQQETAPGYDAVFKERGVTAEHFIGHVRAEVVDSSLPSPMRTRETDRLPGQ
jgi:heme-degrading monooxygenase HmoA